MRKYLVALLVLLTILSSISLIWASADDGENPYYSTETIVAGDGLLIEKTIINGPSKPPKGYEQQLAAIALPEPNLLMGTNTLNVPAYDWFMGCSATSGAMIAAYYDRNGFPNMYSGPSNGGVMPLDSSIWPDFSDGQDTYEQCPLTASHNGLDGRIGRGSIDDYWVQYGSTTQDPYITNGWTQHTWGDAIGDFMKTSQSAYGNSDGSTTFYTWTSSPARLTCDDMVTYGITRDGTYGRKLFYEARGYTVTDCYNQKTDNNSGGFTYAMYKAEIDAGRPVMLNLQGHTVVGVGYSDPSTIYIHDTWDYATHNMTWGGSYSGMTLLSVSIVNLENNQTGSLNGTISDQNSASPIVGAVVSALGSSQTTSGAGGVYSLTLPAGVYTITVAASGYWTNTIGGVSISPNITTTLNINLTPFSALQRTPAILESSMILGARTSIPLTLTTASELPVTFSLQEELGGFQMESISKNVPAVHQAASSLIPDARRSPDIVGRSSPINTIQNTEAALLDEGFEGGAMPPSGWNEVTSNTSYNWETLSSIRYSGSYAANVAYDPAPAFQDEWLLSPQLAPVAGTLSFWSMGSLYWCRDTYNNCDLNIWLVVGEIGGSDDILIGKGDDAWTASFTWSQSVFDLGAIMPDQPVRIGFEYVGYDGAQIGLDAITLQGIYAIPWLQENPKNGSLSSTQNQVVEITFDASAVSQTGQYTGTLHILSANTTNPDVSVPVVMHVLPPKLIFLPCIQH